MRSAANIKARIQITSFDWTSSGFKRHQVVEKTATTLESKPDHSGDAFSKLSNPLRGGPDYDTHVSNEYASQHWGSSARIPVTAKRHPSHFKSCSLVQQVYTCSMSTSAGSAHTRRVFGLREQCSSHVLPLTCNHCWNTSPCIQKTPPRPCRRCGIKSWTRGIICA